MTYYKQTTDGNRRMTEWEYLADKHSKGVQVMHSVKGMLIYRTK